MVSKQINQGASAQIARIAQSARWPCRSTGVDRYAAWALGAVLPTLTFVMGRLAALLWTSK